MNDRMTPIPFDQLMHLIFASPTSILGINQIFKSLTTKTLYLFNEKLELPFGPAAGPHTQLSQNIIAAYLAGARFFELKTVQTLDGEDLPVSKPCIHAPDECYNVEWSTELTVQEAFDEYAKAWFALKLLAKELELGDEESFIFNMSVGYDLEGIQSPKIDTFIENLKDASRTPIWESCKNWALDHLSLFSKVDKTYIHAISPHISHSITLSTLHGCPPDEIERIATYLLTKKNLHTYIKCNPTLLGYEFTRSALDQLGYEYLSFDTHHFTHDLQYAEAIPMLKRLLALSQSLDLSFGVKLTNTFPVKIISKELPGEEMYMSGRALFPLTINLAAKLAETFSGMLPISFSGGADAFNIEKLFETGIYPITLATTLLKPGGYNRLAQCAYKLIVCDYAPKSVLDVEAIKHLAQLSLTDPHYKKPIKPLPSHKIKAKVPLLDCTLTPCSNGCPINQDIPLYIRLIGEGKYLEALKVITDKNPLPFITGTLCNHNCMNLCRRNFYDKPIAIRDAKLIATENAFDELIESIEPPNILCKDKVAIIGGGPAGLSTAYFLAREGMDVTLFEKRKSLGGIVRHVIPSFRIYKTAIHKDIRLVAKYGVKFELEKEITSLEALKDEGYTYIVVATGAWKPSTFSLSSAHTLNVLDFLLQAKSHPKALDLGKNIAIIGGGNTAMDAARAAKRLDGVENVSLIYRRSKYYMPADEEELELALKDGILFKELLSPVAHQDGLLTCQKMILGAPDISGRRSPIATDDYITLPVDTLITAIGENIDETFFMQNHIACDSSGKAIYNPSTLETTSNIFIAGDVTQGPATVVEAIRDARKVADEILTRSHLSMTSLDSYASKSNSSDINVKKALLKMPDDPNLEYNRCLECQKTCACCIDVCPNRANTLIDCNGSPQILHIDRMCNECGNCATFCPYSSSPYLSKLTLFHTLKEFETSRNPGFVVLDQDKKYIKLRVNDDIIETTLDHLSIDSKLKEFILTIFENYAYLF